MNATTVFQLKFTKHNFMSSLVKCYLDVRCFDFSVVSFSDPESFKPWGCLPSRKFESNEGGVRSGWGLGRFRGHITVFSTMWGAKFRVRGERAVWPPKGPQGSNGQVDLGFVYVLWWLRFQIYVRMVGFIYADMEGGFQTPRSSASVWCAPLYKAVGDD